MKNYDNLQGGSRARLRKYKTDARRIAHAIACREAKQRGEPAPALADMPDRDWKRYRYPPYYAVTRSPSYAGVIFADTGALDHLRPLQEEDMPRSFAGGWYCDVDGTNTVTGRVAVLPSRKDGPRFLAYAVFSDADGITIDDRTYADVATACYAADSLAERIAEDAREYAEKWNEARELEDGIENDREALHNIRQNIAGQFALIRAGRKDRATVCRYVAVLRDEFSELIGNIREKRERLAAIDG